MNNKREVWSHCCFLVLLRSANIAGEFSQFKPLDETDIICPFIRCAITDNNRHILLLLKSRKTKALDDK